MYAEAPSQGFLPQAGTILRYLEPQGPGIRVDSGVRQGDVITPDFDPLLAKLIVHAPTRTAALARARQALRDFVVLGLRTNVPYLLRVLSHADVEAGAIHTGWLAQQHESLTAPAADGDTGGGIGRRGTASATPARSAARRGRGVRSARRTRDAMAHVGQLAWLSGRWNGVRTARGWLTDDDGTARMWRTP